MSTNTNLNSSRLSINFKDDSSKYNFMLMSIFVCLVFLILVVIFFSKQFRVYRVTNNMNIYIKFQNMSSMKIATIKDYRLADFYVCSSYNSAVSGYQLLDYLSTDMVKKVMQCGCRYLEFQLFSNTFGADSTPVISCGFRTGEWKLALNSINFEDVLQTIADNAFRIFDGTDGTPNNQDPLFISLDLKNNYNYLVNNKIQKLISKYLATYLLDPSYNYQAKNIALTRLRDLMGKVIIISSDGYQGSSLEEIINYSWNYPKLKRLHYKTVDDEFEGKSTVNTSTTNTTETSTSTSTSKLQTDVDKTKSVIEYNELKKFNMSGLTIVVPQKEGDFLTTNFNATNAWELGCQFVCMNFQKIDKNMDIYVNKFKNKAFVLKPKSLRP
jgi:hypothetical protein